MSGKSPRNAKLSAPSFAEMDDPAGAMNRAAARTAHGDPLCCRTEWQLSFAEAFLPGAKPFFRVRGDSVVAFCDARFEDGQRVLMPIDRSWFYGAPLLGEEAVFLLHELLREPAMAADPPCVWISGLTPRGRRQAELASVFRLTHEIEALEVDTPVVQCAASLEGGYDGYLSRRSGHFRRRLRAAERDAQAMGVRFERVVPQDEAEARATFARMVAIEWQSWKGLGRCGMEEPRSSVFYERMMIRHARIAAGRVAFARHDDKDIGFIFGGVAEGAYRGQQFSFVDSWRPHSIGNLLQQETLRWLCEEGVQRYDMGPKMDYKTHWTERQAPMESWLLVPRTRPGART